MAASLIFLLLIRTVCASLREELATPSPGPPAVNCQCSVCRHMYDPLGDAGGVAFADLSDDWVCPVCGASKSAYKPHEAYVCSLCTHVYDPKKDHSGDAFEDLPADWSCPICGAPKSLYHLEPLVANATCGPTPTPPPSPVPTPTPSPSPLAKCPPDSDLVQTDDGSVECLWTSGAHSLTIPSTASEYCEYISDGYFGYTFVGDYECADSAEKTGNFCLWRDGQNGVSIPSGSTADCGRLSEGRIGFVLPAELAETVV